jgi:hypothetical protein
VDFSVRRNAIGEFHSRGKSQVNRVVDPLTQILERNLVFVRHICPNPAIIVLVLARRGVSEDSAVKLHDVGILHNRGEIRFPAMAEKTHVDPELIGRAVNRDHQVSAHASPALTVARARAKTVVAAGTAAPAVAGSFASAAALPRPFFELVSAFRIAAVLFVRARCLSRTFPVHRGHR